MARVAVGCDPASTAHLPSCSLPSLSFTHSRAHTLTLSTQLETDDNLLIPKARAALARYGHQLVIGNELHKRKSEVVFVERSHHEKSRGDRSVTGAQTPPLASSAGDVPGMYTETWLRLPELAAGRAATDEVEIEEFIIQALLERHHEWIAQGEQAQANARQQQKVAATA